MICEMKLVRFAPLLLDIDQYQILEHLSFLCADFVGLSALLNGLVMRRQRKRNKDDPICHVFHLRIPKQCPTFIRKVNESWHERKTLWMEKLFPGARPVNVQRLSYLHSWPIPCLWSVATLTDRNAIDAVYIDCVPLIPLRPAVWPPRSAYAQSRSFGR